MAITKEDIEQAVKDAKKAYDSLPAWQQREADRWFENLRRIDKELTARRVPYVTL